VALDANPGPAEHLDQQDRTRHITHALDTLSEDHRDLIIMHDIEGYTLPELTVIFEQPLGTLKSRLHRARKKLQQQIKMEPFNNARRVSG
jgi:RNA polymerase sigma-70 factor (ECF subfamily)